MVKLLIVSYFSHTHWDGKVIKVTKWFVIQKISSIDPCTVSIPHQSLVSDLRY